MTPEQRAALFGYSEGDMTILNADEAEYQRPRIDLRGPDGNVFVLISAARKYARQLKIPHEPIIEQMMSGDYETAIAAFDKHFGKYVDLIR